MSIDESVAHGTGTKAETFGDYLRAYRRAADLSQSALARLVHLDHTYIGLLERGARDPSRATVLELAEALSLNAGRTDRLLFSAGLAPENDYQTLWEAQNGAIDDRRKWCPRCQSLLPAGPRGRFSRDRARHDGLHPICKGCESNRSAEYRTRKALAAMRAS